MTRSRRRPGPCSNLYPDLRGVYTVTRPLSRLRPSSDDDPTGVQRILATLPDPGPMPPELVERITASLAVEQERRGAAAGNVRPFVRPEGSDDRRQGSRGLLLGLSGAAAAAAIGGVVLINAMGPTGQQSPNTQAQLLVGAPTAQEGTQGGAADDPTSGAARSGDTHVQVSSTRYTSAQLTAQAQRLWATPAEPVRTLGAEAPAIGPIGTPLGAAECLAAIGAADAARAMVDLALFDGSPAAVVVTESKGHREVRVVTRQCGPESDAVLAGPITLR